MGQLKELPYLAKRGKTICPECGRKTFVNYIYPDGSPVASGECGKCDRLNNCGHHYPPREYFRDHKGRDFTNATKKWKPSRGRVRKASASTTLISKPDFIKPEDLKPTLSGYDKNPLAIYLFDLFGSILSTYEIERVIRDYGLGTWNKWDGAAVFWQIDQYMRIRTGKVMGYDPNTGKRIKKPFNQTTWFHTLKNEDYKKHHLCQCFYGSHLTRNNDKPIWLFESEKTAVMVALALRSLGSNTFIPIASGGCEGFNPDRHSDIYDKHQVLKNRKVVLFPDNGKFEEWKEKAMTLRGYAKSVWISPTLEPDIKRNRRPDYQVNEGDDLGDIIDHHIRNGMDLLNLIMYAYGNRDGKGNPEADRIF